MELRNCPQCGALFHYIGNRLCPACAAAEDEDFKRVREYVYDAPRATIEQISEATGVKSERILKFLREGRLIATDGAPLLTCERCGRPIYTGRFCQDCAKELQGELAAARGAFDQAPARRQERMFTADYLKDKYGGSGKKR